MNFRFTCRPALLRPRLGGPRASSTHRQPRARLSEHSALDELERALKATRLLRLDCARRNDMSTMCLHMQHYSRMPMHVCKTKFDILVDYNRSRLLSPAAPRRHPAGGRGAPQILYILYFITLQETFKSSLVKPSYIIVY